MSTVYKLNQVLNQGASNDCIRVDLCGDTTYCSRQFYEHWVLEMSTGDFHMHQARIAYPGETTVVVDLSGDADEPFYTDCDACAYNFREAPNNKCVVYQIGQYRRRKAK